MKQFHAFYWGGVLSDGLAARFLGTEEQDFWFDTEQQRQEFKDRLGAFAKEHGAGLMFAEHEGVAAQTRTVAVMLFRFHAKEYPFEYDFGVGYPEGSAHYMFEEGNYACDCNRSIFLKLDEEMDCGDKIEMTAFKVEHRPVVSKEARA